MPQHGACNEFQMYFRMALSCRMGEKIIPPKCRLQGLFPAVWKSHPAYKAGRKLKPLPHKLSSPHHDYNLFIWDKKHFLSSFSIRVFCFHHSVQHLMEATHMQSSKLWFFILFTHTRAQMKWCWHWKGTLEKKLWFQPCLGAGPAVTGRFLGRNNGKVELSSQILFGEIT